MKQIMENWRVFLNEDKYGKSQQVLNRGSYSEMIQFKKPTDLFVPLGAKMMQRVFGDLEQEQIGFHITNLNGVYGLLDLRGTTKQVSVMTRGMNKKFIQQGITQKGGVVVELEGRVVASGGKDLFTIPEKGGRRNVGLEMLRNMLAPDTYEGLESDILAAIAEYKSSSPQGQQPAKDPLEWWEGEAIDAKREKNGAKLKEMITFYLDSVEKIMLKYVDDLRDAILTDFKSSGENYQRMGIYDENVMDKIKIKKVYLLNTYYKKRGMDGFPTDEEFKQLISDLDKEGIDLYSAKVGEILDKVATSLQAK